jgi:hypothetical protein
MGARGPRAPRGAAPAAGAAAPAAGAAAPAAGAAVAAPAAGAAAPAAGAAAPAAGAAAPAAGAAAPAEFYFDLRRSPVEFNIDGYSGTIVQAVVYNERANAVTAELEISSSKLFVIVAPADVCRVDAAFIRTARPALNYKQTPPTCSFGVVCIESGEYEFVVRDRKRRLLEDFKMPGRRTSLRPPAVNAGWGPWLRHIWNGGGF